MREKLIKDDKNRGDKSMQANKARGEVIQYTSREGGPSIFVDI